MFQDGRAAKSERIRTLEEYSGAFKELVAAVSQRGPPLGSKNARDRGSGLDIRQKGIDYTGGFLSVQDAINHYAKSCAGEIVLGYVGAELRDRGSLEIGKEVGATSSRRASTLLTLLIPEELRSIYKGDSVKIIDKRTIKEWRKSDDEIVIPPDLAPVISMLGEEIFKGYGGRYNLTKFIWRKDFNSKREKKGLEKEEGAFFSLPKELEERKLDGGDIYNKAIISLEELIERIEMAARSRNPDTNLIWSFLIELINKKDEGISALRKIEDKKILDLVEDILIERYFSSSKEKKKIIKRMLIEIGSPNVIEILKEDFFPSDSNFILLNKIEGELFFLHTIRVNEGQLKLEFLVAVPWRDKNYAYRLYEVSVVWSDEIGRISDEIGRIIGKIVTHFIEILRTNFYRWDILSANYLARLLYLENIPLNRVNIQEIIKVLAQAEEERGAYGFVLNRLKKVLLEKIREAIEEGDYVYLLLWGEKVLVNFTIDYLTF